MMKIELAIGSIPKTKKETNTRAHELSLVLTILSDLPCAHTILCHRALQLLCQLR